MVNIVRTLFNLDRRERVSLDSLEETEIEKYDMPVPPHRLIAESKLKENLKGEEE